MVMSSEGKIEVVGIDILGKRGPQPMPYCLKQGGLKCVYSNHSKYASTKSFNSY